ncbi:hypothetical protein J6590_104723 [Homalodisca vitripennis]|nr:hypothetical protein J6590_104723 [Homalodisca vitripennis]
MFALLGKAPNIEGRRYDKTLGMFNPNPISLLTSDVCFTWCYDKTLGMFNPNPISLLTSDVCSPGANLILLRFCYNIQRYFI